jgi:hypothetical protein
MLTATIAVGLIALAVQTSALRGMGERRPIGDEWSYLERGRSEDPLAPRLFLRPPIFPWLASLCHGGTDGRGPDVGERRLRTLVAMASVLTVWLTAVAAWRLGGPSVALLSAFFLAAHSERILLGCHIWPDTLLAAMLAALMVVSTLPERPAAAVFAGGLCAFGVMIRIDFLVVPPVLLAAWSGAPGSSSALMATALVAPTLVTLIVMSVRNSRRYGIPLPDTTWAFNLMVAREDARLSDGNQYEVEGTVHRALTAWRDLPPADVAGRGLAALGEILRAPLRFGRGVGRRLLILVGPDTFIRQRLLPRDAAYPDLAERQRRVWETSLIVATPFLVTMAVVGAVIDRRPPDGFAWPSLALAAAIVLFHTRTRYRVALLPALSVIAAQAIVALESNLRGARTTALVFVVAVLVLWALLRVPYADDLRT